METKYLKLQHQGFCVVLPVHPVYSVNAVCVFSGFSLYLISSVLTNGQANTNFKPKNLKKVK